MNSVSLTNNAPWMDSPPVRRSIGKVARSTDHTSFEAQILDTSSHIGASLHHRYSSLFCSDEWQEVLRRSYGLNFSMITAGRGSDSRGKVYFSLVNDVKGRRIVSLPFSDYCDPLVETKSEWLSLSEQLFHYDAPVRFRILHNLVPLTDSRFDQKVLESWHGVDLTLAEDLLWQNMDGGTKRNIEKARKLSVTVRQSDSLEDCMIFSELHAGLRRRKYQLLSQPRSFFRNLHEVFHREHKLKVLLAEREGRAIAGILFLIYGDTLYYKFNASTDLECRPNDLLVWFGIQMGKQLHLKTLDFGISSLSQPGLIRFKSKFATIEKSVTRMSWVPPNHVNRQEIMATELLSKLTKLLTAEDVPAELLAESSEFLYPLFC